MKQILAVDNDHLTRLVTKWIIQAQLPFTTVESSGFLDVINYLNPRAKVFKADTVRKHVTELYEKYHLRVMKLLGTLKEERRFSITTDVWTSPHNKVVLLKLLIL